MFFADLVQEQDIERSCEDDNKHDVSNAAESIENKLEHDDEIDSDTT